MRLKYLLLSIIVTLKFPAVVIHIETQDVLTDVRPEIAAPLASAAQLH